MSLGCPPAPVYKGAREEEAGPRRGRTKCGVLPGLGLPSPSRIPPPIWNRNPQGGGKRERGPATSPSPNRTRGGGRRVATLGCPFLLSTKAHEGPYGSRGVPVTSRYSGKIPISPGTLPISKYRLPIYQSLCLDHFETPRHVPDLIRDSELLRYIKTHKLII